MTAQAQQLSWPPARRIDASRLQRQGLRVLHGDHLTLVTDLPSSPEIDELPRVFDAAVPAWAARFGVAEDKTRDWRVLACLIGEGERFVAAGLAPDTGIEFPHGLSKGHELWLREQETDYYRRHLLLHEGTHSFMSTQLGACGPSWHMEGVAELLGMHAWDPVAGELRLGVMLPDGPDARSIGRVGLLRDAVIEHAALTIPAVMRIDNRRVLDNRSYAWVWALAAMLDSHPRYRDRFRDLPRHVLDPRFDDRFRSAFEPDWSDLSLEWRIMIATLEYGHDIGREAIAFQRGEALSSPVTANIQAARGWQSTGVLVEAGKTYRVQADGRFQIARLPDGRPVPCEAGGVTLEYHRGRPLGVLLAAIDPRGIEGQNVSSSAAGGLLSPAALGLAKTFRAPYFGTLYLRVNDSPAKLADNEGELRVRLSTGGATAD